MTKLGFIGAAAVALSSALASPAMAQQVISDPGYCAQFYPNANCQNKGPGNPYTGDYQRRAAYRTSGVAWDNRRDRRYDYDSGFLPLDVAAGVVGGAVGTAGAIATAPFRGNSYAYYNDGYRGGPRQSYAPQSYATLNGFVCRPGTWFKGEDGRRHPCQ